MPLADIPGVRLHYELEGDPSLPVLVLSNSLGVNLAMWESQLQTLAGLVRLLRYDTRGQGNSSLPVGPYTIAELGHDVLSFLDALNIAKASFCGLSMGGAIGQWLGVHAPDRIDKLILSNTAAKIGNKEAWNARIALVQREGLAPVISGTLERWLTADFRESHPEAVVRVRAMLEATQVEGYAACCAAVRDFDMRDSIARIASPTLVISGTADPVTTIEDGQWLAANIPNAEYVELPAAHLSNVEASDAFNAAILSFLTD
jgi:3-oxoadipate enol-lactonase